MSYKTQAMLAQDYNLQRRITACAATQNVANPVEWTASKMWKLSAEPGWAIKYANALAAGNVNPGDDEDVISDQMILSSVQPLVTS